MVLKLKISAGKTEADLSDELVFAVFFIFGRWYNIIKCDNNLT
jgi:hypothetical protein